MRRNRLHVTFSNLFLCFLTFVCAGLMSRVQAVKDHHGKDCRFLSFRQGDTIFVYHKLTGKREDIWAGSVRIEFSFSFFLVIDTAKFIKNLMH